MKRPAFFSSSSKIWSSIDWVFGIEECGYDGWEISADGNYRLDNPDARARIRDALDCTGLKATVHAPYSDLNLASLNHPIYRETIRQLILCVEMAADFTDIVTIHPGYLSPPGKLVPEKVWAQHKEGIAEIGRAAEDAGVVVCLENMPDIPDFFCRYPEELFGMIDGVDGVCATIDIGHANTLGKVDDYLEKVGLACHLHLHDNHGLSDEHLALKDGTIDWDEVGRALSRNYHGICVVEGRNLEEAKRSLPVVRGWFS